MVKYITGAHICSGMSLILGTVRYKITSSQYVGEDKVMLGLRLNGLRLH